MADRITVVRRGQTVGTAAPAASTEQSLAELMVGRPVELVVKKKKAQAGKTVLSVENVFLKSPHHGGNALNDVSFEVRTGEVLGIAGVQGNGQTEIVEAITGLQHIDAGHIKISGQEVTHATPRQITELGVSHVPEDRQKEGLVLSFPIKDNMMLNTYYKDFANGIILDEAKLVETATKWVKEFDVRTPSIDTSAGSLSGGNQQKVIVAREFSRPLKLLIAAQPTRGVDVGSIEYIHARIIEKRDEGAAILVVSTELDEVRALSDRIAVMFDGHVVAIVDADKVSKDQLGLLMAGVPAVEVLNKPVKETRV